MIEKPVPWWRKALNFALGGIRSGFGLFGKTAKPEVQDAVAPREEPVPPVLQPSVEVEPEATEQAVSPGIDLPGVDAAEEPASAPESEVASAIELPAETPAGIAAVVVPIAEAVEEQEPVFGAANLVEPELGAETADGDASIASSELAVETAVVPEEEAAEAIQPGPAVLAAAILFDEGLSVAADEASEAVLRDELSVEPLAEDEPTEETAEKAMSSAGLAKSTPQGLKPDLYSELLAARLKSCPVTEPMESPSGASFSAAREAQAQFGTTEVARFQSQCDPEISSPASEAVAEASAQNPGVEGTQPTQELEAEQADPVAEAAPPGEPVALATPEADIVAEDAAEELPAFDAEPAKGLDPEPADRIAEPEPQEEPVELAAAEGEDEPVAEDTLEIAAVSDAEVAIAPQEHESLEMMNQTSPIAEAPIESAVEDAVEVGQPAEHLIESAAEVAPVETLGEAAAEVAAPAEPPAEEAREIAGEARPVDLAEAATEIVGASSPADLAETAAALEPVPEPLPVSGPNAAVGEVEDSPTAEASTEPAPDPVADEKAAAKQLAVQKKRDEASEDSPFSVMVDKVYDGPLDLLLDLIRAQDIDIYDIPIAKITAQFLAYVNQLKATDVDVAGEFIYTASLLIHIKSKMLLPRTPNGPDDAAEDPRRELVDRLLEHERFKNAAQMLQQKQVLEAATWTNPGLREFKDDEATEPEIAADTVDLVRIFRDILERARNRPVLDVEEDSVTVGQMIQFLSRRLTMEDKPIALRKLLSHTRSERALVAMFLALLELVRLQAVLLRQDQAFSDIFIKKHTGFETVMNQGLTNALDDWR
jgi:segregation and condensation protein A